VANAENGAGPVFQNALPETVMAVLRNGPGPFWQSFWSLYRTILARSGGRYGRFEKRTSPVSEVVLTVLRNDPHPFWRSFW
jgi:hypothetical protein